MEAQDIIQADRKASPSSPPITGLIVGASDVLVWGLTSAERTRRAFRRAGIVEGRTVTGTQILIRADHVLDETLIKDLAGMPQTVLVTADRATPVAAHCGPEWTDKLIGVLSGTPAPDLRRTFRLVSPGELSSTYRGALRKRETPFVLPLSAARLREIEDRMFAGSYKGVTDFITKYVWPLPAFWVTRLAAAARIPPNAVTLLGLLLVILAFWLFLQGQFAAGLVAAWLMTFLDTVDGKLARVTLTSTRTGDILDHGVDLIHPPFWYFAWIAGLERVGMPLPEASVVTAIVVGGYVLGRLQEALFIRLFGIQIHVWRPIDSWFRLFAARRNPNLFMLTMFTVLGRPDYGMLAVAVWTCLSLAFHSVRIVQALLTHGLGRRLTSWLAAAS
jgi:phosphatidylglycerophosphate synthase